MRIPGPVASLKAVPSSPEYAKVRSKVECIMGGVTQNPSRSTLIR